MARFATSTVGSQVLVLPKDVALHAAGQSAGATTSTSWWPPSCADLRIEPSGLCSDEVFLRRVTIDITGLLPTGRRVSGVHDTTPSPDKRAKLVDRLLARKEFSEIWAMKWANLADDQGNGQRRQREVGRALFQLADQPDLQQRAARSRWSASCWAPAAARSRTRRRTTTRSNATRSRRPKTWPRCSWASAPSAPSATTIRSIAGRWTTTTASPPSSRRSAASRPRITAS